MDKERVSGKVIKATSTLVALTVIMVTYVENSNARLRQEVAELAEQRATMAVRQALMEQNIVVPGDTIGPFCSIGENVTIGNRDPKLAKVSRGGIGKSSKPLPLAKESAIMTHRGVCELQPELEDKYSHRVAEVISAESSKHDLDSLWMVAVAYTESRFKMDCISPVGAIGCMQVMPNTAEYMGVAGADLHNLETNVSTGIKYFKYLVDKYDGDVRMATIAYNQGPGNVARGTYKTWYYDRVLTAYNKIKNI